jgi:hypothetical protein
LKKIIGGGAAIVKLGALSAPNVPYTRRTRRPILLLFVSNNKWMLLYAIMLALAKDRVFRELVETLAYWIARRGGQRGSNLFRRA